MSQPNRPAGYTIKPTIDFTKFQAMVNRAVSAHSRGIGRHNRQVAREALRRSLRPRLRWVADRPDAHRIVPVLIRAGLLTPPTLTSNRYGRVIRVARTVNR